MAKTDHERLVSGLTPFTAEECKRLHLYRRRVASLQANPVANQRSIELTVASDGGNILHGVTLEQIKAVCTDIRLLGFNKADKSNATFDAIRNLIHRHALPDTPDGEHFREYLRELKALKARVLDESAFMPWTVNYDDGSTLDVTPKYLINLIFNGDVFHDDEELREAFDRLGGWDDGIVRAQFTASARGLVVTFASLDALTEDILGTPELASP